MVHVADRLDVGVHARVDAIQKHPGLGRQVEVDGVEHLDLAFLRLAPAEIGPAVRGARHVADCGEGRLGRQALRPRRHRRRKEKEEKEREPDPRCALGCPLFDGAIVQGAF